MRRTDRKPVARSGHLGGSQRFATDFNITSREEALQLLDELNTELIA